MGIRYSMLVSFVYGVLWCVSGGFFVTGLLLERLPITVSGAVSLVCFSFSIFFLLCDVSKLEE